MAAEVTKKERDLAYQIYMQWRKSSVTAHPAQLLADYREASIEERMKPLIEALKLIAKADQEGNLEDQHGRDVSASVFAIRTLIIAGVEI